jgi:hypothetical protein
MVSPMNNRALHDRIYRTFLLHLLDMLQLPRLVKENFLEG